MRIVSADLDYLLYAPVKEFITMAVLLIGNIPLIYVLNKSWFQTLVYTIHSVRVRPCDLHFNSGGSPADEAR